MSTPAGSAVTPSGSTAPAGGGDGVVVELEGGIGGIEVTDVEALAELPLPAARAHGSRSRPHAPWRRTRVVYAHIQAYACIGSRMRAW